MNQKFSFVSAGEGLECVDRGKLQQNQKQQQQQNRFLPRRSSDSIAGGEHK